MYQYVRGGSFFSSPKIQSIYYLAPVIWFFYIFLHYVVSHDVDVYDVWCWSFDVDFVNVFNVNLAQLKFLSIFLLLTSYVRLIYNINIPHEVDVCVWCHILMFHYFMEERPTIGYCHKLYTHLLYSRCIEQRASNFCVVPGNCGYMTTRESRSFK